MSKKQVNGIKSLEQELILAYQEKWRSIALCLEPIDRQKTSQAVKAIYHAVGIQEPEIMFFDSPNLAFKSNYQTLQKNYLKHPQNWRLIQEISKIQCNFTNEILNKIGDISDTLSDYIFEQLYLELDLPFYLWSWIVEQCQGTQEAIKFLHTSNRIETENWIRYCCLIDFCVSVLYASYEGTIWKEFEVLVENCGWVYPFPDLCIICDRPRQLSFDREGRLHAEKKPAIEFSDGFGLYYYHGVTLPEQYGKVHPRRWNNEIIQYLQQYDIQVEELSWQF